jgi:hypothetical protein
VPHLPARGKSETGQRAAVQAGNFIQLAHILLGWYHQENSQRVAQGPSLPPDPLNIGAAAQAVASWKH